MERVWHFTGIFLCRQRVVSLQLAVQSSLCHCLKSSPRLLVLPSSTECTEELHKGQRAVTVGVGLLENLSHTVLADWVA